MLTTQLDDLLSRDQGFNAIKAERLWPMYFDVRIF